VGYGFNFRTGSMNSDKEYPSPSPPTACTCAVQRQSALTKVVFLLPDSEDAPSFRQLPSGVGDTPRGALSPPPPPFTFSALAPLRGGDSDGVRRREVRGSEPPRSPPPLPDRKTLVNGPAPQDTVYKLKIIVEFRGSVVRTEVRYRAFEVLKNSDD
jgi:hypothetical protein